MTTNYDEFIGPGSRQQCQICGKPNMTLKHRQKCLQRSEKAIYKQLRKNKCMECQEKGLFKCLRCKWH